MDELVGIMRYLKKKNCISLALCEINGIEGDENKVGGRHVK